MFIYLYDLKTVDISMLSGYMLC